VVAELGDRLVSGFGSFEVTEKELHLTAIDLVFRKNTAREK
jgi:hypothetical protein